jgi:formate hydrogenlyase subunit 3/multisubunit Na+/H+ antiporter MnhD subunit
LPESSESTSKDAALPVAEPSTGMPVAEAVAGLLCGIAWGVAACFVMNWFGEWQDHSYGFKRLVGPFFPLLVLLVDGLFLIPMTVFVWKRLGARFGKWFTAGWLSSTLLAIIALVWVFAQIFGRGPGGAGST